MRSDWSHPKAGDPAFVSQWLPNFALSEEIFFVNILASHYSVSSSFVVLRSFGVLGS